MKNNCTITPKYFSWSVTAVFKIKLNLNLKLKFLIFQLRNGYKFHGPAKEGCCLDVSCTLTSLAFSWMTEISIQNSELYRHLWFSRFISATCSSASWFTPLNKLSVFSSKIKRERKIKPNPTNFWCPLNFLSYFSFTFSRSSPWKQTLTPFAGLLFADKLTRIRTSESRRI